MKRESASRKRKARRASWRGAAVKIFAVVMVALFFASGGLSLTLRAVYDSFSLWPLTSFIMPVFSAESGRLFVAIMDDILGIGLMLVAAIVLAMLLADLSLALVARARTAFEHLRAVSDCEELRLRTVERAVWCVSAQLYSGKSRFAFRRLEETGEICAVSQAKPSDYLGPRFIYLRRVGHGGCALWCNVRRLASTPISYASSMPCAIPASTIHPAE